MDPKDQCSPSEKRQLLRKKIIPEFRPWEESKKQKPATSPIYKLKMIRRGSREITRIERVRPEEIEQQSKELQPLQLEQQQHTVVQEISANSASFQSQQLPQVLQSLPSDQQQVGNPSTSQQDVTQTTPIAATTPSKISKANPVTVCKIAQQFVHEIVVRTQQMFLILKSIAPPFDMKESESNSNKQTLELKKSLDIISVLFKRLKVAYQEIDEEMKTINNIDVESLIPMKDDPIKGKYEDRKETEVFKEELANYNDISKQVVEKNVQLKEIADHLRNLVKEINVLAETHPTGDRKRR